MEVSLRKPQREIFNTAKKYPGSFFRKYKKSSNQVRSYLRLMTADFSPIRNFSSSAMRPFFEMSIMESVGVGEFKIKEGVVLAVKKKKSKYNSAA